MSKTLIISLVYHEPEWQETRRLLEGCGYPVVYIDRQGVGSMAKAYNDAFKQHAAGYEFVWFVSNITFDPKIIRTLEHAMKVTNYAAISPAFKSDHEHMRQDKSTSQVKEVHFVEFTCPIVRTEIFRVLMLDEEMPYVGHDMAWGADVRERGYKIGVHHGVTVNHTYIRHNKGRHPATIQRLKNRRAADDRTVARLTEKYGPDYKEKIRYFNKLES